MISIRMLAARCDFHGVPRREVTNFAEVRGFSCFVFGAALFTCGCGNKLVQTAELSPDAPLVCNGAGALVLPSDAIFGDGTEAASRLVGTSYAAGNGPGLYVTARDAFRVYLNGELVTESSAARAPVFVPLSLLPGDNALTVVLAAKRGTPAALLQLDDLDQSYVSDSSWKVSSAPSDGYRNANYDDSAWLAAKDFGALGTVPGCDPDSVFPADSVAHWIGPPNGAGSTAVLRKVISLAAVGYGAGTTGGAGAMPTLVSTWAELKAAAEDADTPAVILLPEGVSDFRATARDQATCPGSCTNDPTKPQYTVLTSTETCATSLVTRTRNEHQLLLGSNKTVVGLGRGAAVRGVVFDFGSSQNDIVRNLAVYDVNRSLTEAGDAFTLGSPSQIWVDHCTTKWISDGFTDVSAGTKNVTLSWMHYDGVTTDECDGEHTRAATVTDSVVTFHHCFFDHVETHAPSVHDSLARVHLFDNLISDDLGYGVASVCGAQVLMEANTFQRVATPTDRSTCTDGTGPGLINAPAGSNYYGDDVGANHGADGNEPRNAVFKPPYAYTTEDPQTEWLTVFARAGCGGRWAQPLSLAD